MKNNVSSKKIKTLKKLILIRNFCIDVIQIIIGTAIMSFGITAFLLPNKLSFGGITGIATIVYYIFGTPIGNVVLLCNVPLFILAFFKFGKKFCIKSLIGTVFLSLFLNIFENISAITYDRLLASIAGGIIVGIGTVVVFHANASTGGSDIMVKYIKKKVPNLKTGSITATIDTLIVLANVFFLKDIEIGLYSAITIFAIGRMIDTAYEGIGFSKTIFIISKHHKEIARAISLELERGVTGIYSKGMYTNTDNIMLLCVVGRNEVSYVRNIVNKIDSKAFMIISNTREVLGQGFGAMQSIAPKSEK